MIELGKFAAACVAVLCAFGANAEPLKSCTMRVGGYVGSTELTDFPLLVKISPQTVANFSYADCAADGSDISFADLDGNVLPHEIDTWDPDGMSLVWVKLPKLSGKDTKLVFRWKDDNPDENNPASVWSDYAGVWHLGEQTGNSYADSTGHGFTATNAVSATIAESCTAKAGKVGDGRWQPKLALRIPSYDEQRVGGTFTASGWYYMDERTGYESFFSRKQDWNAGKGWSSNMQNNDKNLFVAGSDGVTSTAWNFGASVKGRWIYFTLVYNGTKVALYENGAKVGNDITITTVEDNGRELVVGNNSKGTIDEIRIRKGAASADWIKAQHDQMSQIGFVSPDASSAEDLTPNLIANGSFESGKLTGNGNAWQQNCPDANNYADGWTGKHVLTTKNNTWCSQTLPDGVRVMGLQGGNSATNVFTAPYRGVYRLTFSHAQRSGWIGDYWHLTTISVDGKPVMSVVADKTTWVVKSSTFMLDAGTHALSFKGTGFSGFDQTGLFDKISLACVQLSCDTLFVTGDPDEAGEVVPAYGTTNGLAVGESFVCSAPIAWTNAAGNVAYDCIGYKVYAGGKVVGEDVGNEFTYEHPDCVSGATLVWQWEKEYRVTVGADVGGTATAVDVWKKTGETVSFTATPEEGYTFAGWIGNLPDEQDRHNPSVEMTVGAEPVALTAAFESAEEPPAVYLKADATGTGTGRGWANAYTDVSNAIYAAVAAGKPLHVAQGVYIISKTIPLPKGFKVYGGFPGRSVSETMADRDPARYQTIFTGDRDLDDVWVHYEPNTSFGLTSKTLAEPVIKDGRINEPPAFTGAYDGYCAKHNGTNTSIAFKGSSGWGEMNGVTISGFTSPGSGDGYSVVNLTGASGGVYTFNDVRFTGNRGGYGTVYMNGSHASKFWNCRFEYEWSGARGGGITVHSGTCGDNISNCVFKCVSKTAADAGMIFNGWGGGVTARNCTITRCCQASGTSWQSMYGGAGLIYCSEGGGVCYLYDCVMTNNWCATSSGYGPSFFAGRATTRWKRCVFSHNVAEAKPTAGKAFSMIAANEDTGKPYRAFEACTFEGNVMRAREVAATSGGYALGIIGNNVQGADSTLLNCSFKDNVAETAVEKAGVTPVLCRGVLTYAPVSGQTDETGLANCTFLGPKTNMYDVVQYGSAHDKALNLVNCIFEADGDAQPVPVYAEVPQLVKFYGCSILNKFSTDGEEATYEGLAYDKIPLVQKVVNAANGRWALQPAAKVPDLYETCNVATNSDSWNWAFKRPGEGTSWEALTPALAGLSSGKVFEQRLVGDAAGAARPAGAFARGALQTLTETAENGHSLVLRREPYAAGAFSRDFSQSVAPGGQMEPVTATSVNPKLYTFAGWFDLGGTRVSDSATLENLDLTEELTVLVGRFDAPKMKITLDLGECGVFDETGESAMTLELAPGEAFPPIPAWTRDPAWHFVGFDTPQFVPEADTTYRAKYVSSAVRVIRVTAEGAGRMDGTDWDNAYGADHLAEAYADAGAYRGELWLKKGLYVIKAPVQMIPNVTVRGGFAGGETSADEADPAANPTILSGDVNGDGYWRPEGSNKGAAGYEIWTEGEDGEPVFNPPNPNNANYYWDPAGNNADNTPNAFANSAGNATNSCFNGLVFTLFKSSAVITTSGSAQNLRFERCRFLACNAELPTGDNGIGVIRVVNSPVVMTDCEFDGCWNAVSIGTATSVRSVFTGCRFLNCASADGCAGGIRPFDSALLAVTNCLFYRCFNSQAGHQGGAAISLRSGSGTHLFTDCTFEENRAWGNSHGTFVFAAGNGANLLRCRFLRNKLNNTDAYESKHSPCLSHCNSWSAAYLRDCFFDGNYLYSTVNNTDNSPAAVFAASGPVTMVNCTILNSTNYVTGASTRGGTLTSWGSAFALVNCVIKDTVDRNGNSCELYVRSTPTVGIVNSVFASSDANYAFMKCDGTATVPTVANSYVQGFDVGAYTNAANANAYFYEVATNGDACVRSRVEEGPNGAAALRVGAGCPAKARPVWLSGTTVYFYDDVANAAKPWRNAIDRGSYSASVSGLALDSPCIPDAFGTPRRHVKNGTRFTCGPLYTPNGFLLIVR